jgi:hypothetical protein
MHASMAMQGLAHPGASSLFHFLFFFPFLLSSPRGNSLGRPISFRKTAQQIPAQTPRLKFPF